MTDEVSVVANMYFVVAILLQNDCFDRKLSLVNFTLRSNVELHMRQTKLQFELIQTSKVRPLGQTLNLIRI